MKCLKYCVVGFPVRHSLSPKIHNKAFRKLGIRARYGLAEVAPKDFGKFMRDFRARYAGANVTIPYKERVMKYLDWISPEARKVGAVNVIVNRRGKLFGYNTDVFGAMKALRSGAVCHPARTSVASALPIVVKTSCGKKWLKGKSAVVLGAGGAARAVIYGLKKAGARVLILNRTLSRAKKLAREFGCEVLSLRPRLGGGSNLSCDILINATSVGMWPRVNEIPLPNFLSLRVPTPKGVGAKQSPLVMDIIYRPRMTKFLRDAKKAGCRIITGDKMFLAQAQKSFELFSYFFKNSAPVTSGGGGASSCSGSP